MPNAIIKEITEIPSLDIAKKKALQMQIMNNGWTIEIIGDKPPYRVRGTPPNLTNPSAGSEFCFPLKNKPSQSYCSGGRQFGAQRDNGDRKHAGCDLIAAADTPIFAMAEGVVISNPHEFYQGTYVLEIKHENGMIVRYGEISPNYPSEIKEGVRVLRGQKIAYVGQLPSGKSMLHLEMYKGTMNGDFRREDDPYKRRKDLTDPTSYLDNASIV